MLMSDWRTAALRDDVKALLGFAEVVTRTPHAVQAAQIDALRAAGWSDVAIHDAIQVVAYFNYINRVADAIGVPDEPEFRGWGEPPEPGRNKRSTD